MGFCRGRAGLGGAVVGCCLTMAARKKSSRMTQDEAEVLLDRILYNGSMTSDDGWSVLVQGDEIRMTGPVPLELVAAITRRQMDMTVVMGAMPADGGSGRVFSSSDFMDRVPDRDILDRATNIRLRAYNDDLRRTARALLQGAVEQGYRSYFEWQGSDDYLEAIEGSADSHVTYIPASLETLVLSDNWLAHEDHDLHLGATSEGLIDIVTMAAFWAYRADLERYIDAFEDEYFTEDEDEDEDDGD